MTNSHHQLIDTLTGGVSKSFRQLETWLNETTNIMKAIHEITMELRNRETLNLTNDEVNRKLELMIRLSSAVLNRR